MSLSEVDRRQLDEQGYLVLPGFMDDGLLGELRARMEQLFDEEGEAAGSESKRERGGGRLATLADRGEVSRRIIALPQLLDHVRQVLGPAIKLSSLNARLVLPYGARAQPLHADMAAVAD